MVRRDLAGVNFAASLPSGDGWRAAVEHPFVDAIANGSLARERFDRWIQQDHLFVRGLARFVRRLVELAPETDREGLESGLAALDPELELFRAYAARRGVDLAALPVDACSRYLAFLRNAAERGYADGLVVYYGCERAYLEAWTRVRERAGTAGPYGDWIGNWTSEGFRAYVGWLGERLDAIAIGADEATLNRWRDAFARTVEMEVDFWDACFSGGGA